MIQRDYHFAEVRRQVAEMLAQANAGRWPEWPSLAFGSPACQQTAKPSDIVLVRQSDGSYAQPRRVRP